MFRMAAQARWLPPVLPSNIDTLLQQPNQVRKLDISIGTAQQARHNVMLGCFLVVFSTISAHLTQVGRRKHYIKAHAQQQERSA
jgi:hypothetical protein